MKFFHRIGRSRGNEAHSLSASSGFEWDVSLVTSAASVRWPHASPWRGFTSPHAGCYARLGRGLWRWVTVAILLAASFTLQAQLRFVTVVPAAANTGFPDEDGEYPAYIEIRSVETGVLTGHFLTDQSTGPTQWQVPAGYVLGPGQTIRIFASGKNRRPAGPGGILHTSFTYDCSVPYCGLFNSQQVLVHTYADRTDHCSCNGLVLIDRGAIARTLIPTQDLGVEWTLPGFDDKNWIRGPIGVGYDAATTPPLYAGLIGTDVLSQMKGFSSTAYIRVPFNLSFVPSLATSLTLRLKYNDGFVAYLNGAEVARRHAPDILDDLAAAEKDRPDTAALAGEAIDLTAYIGLLKPGGNVLAFHALTIAPDSSRFLVNPAQLCLGIEPTGIPGGECIKETNGRDFWVAFPQNFAQELDTPLRLSLCIAGRPQTKGVVEIPGLQVSGFPRNFTIPPAGALTLTLPRTVELAGADSVEAKGIHITASADVAVYGTTRMDFTTDSFLGLPTKCLGTEYLVSSYQNVFDGIPILNGTQFGIVAVANSTVVTIVPLSAVGTHPAHVPYSIQLNRGQTYQLRNTAGLPVDLTGTQILSTKPIGVFGSHRCANIQSVNQFFCDTLVEELLPVSSWGSSFFLAPLATRQSDTVRVLSSADDNLVTVLDSNGSQSFNLQRAQFKDLVLDLPTRISCRQPSTIMQFSNSSDADDVINADPFMAMIQPSTTWLSQYRICTPAAADFGDNYINLIATTQVFLDSTTINGTAVAAWPAADITKGSLPSGLVYARIKLKPATVYLIDGRGSIGLTAYGFSEYDSYGYPGGMRFNDTQPPILICPEEVTLNCAPTLGVAAGCVAAVPNLMLKSSFFDDCTPEGQLVVTQTPSPGTPLQPGTYQVVITATDGGGNKAECVVKLTVESGWEEQQFGPAIASNPALEVTVWGATADPDQDGIPNATEKALGSHPNLRNSVASLLEVSTHEDQGAPFLVISLPRLVGEGGPVVELEGVAALGSPWQSGADIFEELPSLNTPLPGGKHEMAAFKARHTEGAGSTSAYFVRLKLKP